MGYKKLVKRALLPLARSYIRYSPGPKGKAFLFDRFHWEEREYLARTKVGTRMRGQASDLVQGYIYYFGVWEPNLSAFISRRLRGHPERTFVDVGANVGYFTLLASRLLKNGHVVSVEAFPGIFEKLKANVALNGAANVRLVPLAATDIPREIGMYHSGGENEGATTTVAGRYDAAAVTVKGEPLSKILRTAELRATKLVKIDVEGAEHSVIQGLRQVFGQLPYDAEVVVEVSAQDVPEGEMVPAIFEMFSDAGYFPYVLKNEYNPDHYIHARHPVPPSRITSIPGAQSDVVFSRLDADHL